MSPSLEYSEKRPDLDGNTGLKSYVNNLYIPELIGISQTLICKILTDDNVAYTVRALIDGGSQITAVRKDIVHELGIRGPKRTLKFGTSGAKEIIYNNMMIVNFKLASLDGKFITDFHVEAITMPKVTFDINKIEIDPNNYEHLKFLNFTERLPHTEMTSRKVDLLIGEPIVSQIQKRIILGKSIDEPAAVICSLGNCLTGAHRRNEIEIKNNVGKEIKYSRNEIKNNRHNSEIEIEIENVQKKYKTVPNMQKILFSSAVIQPNPPDDIKNWFTLENIGIENPAEGNLSADELRAEELMEKNTYYDSKNLCWHTRLLWADEPLQYTNVKRASATATRVIKRFSKTENSAAWDSIQKVYKENLDLGITELVPSSDLRKKTGFHYIAMSMVFKPESSTTPVRPVYNANLEFGIGEDKTSFNKKLLEGPNLLPQLQTLILQFRYYQKVCLLDISKLYSRIRVSAEDAENQRFFWTDEKMAPYQEKANLKAYRQSRLIFWK